MITEINDVVNATYKEPTEVTLKAMQEFYGIQSVQYGTTEHWNLQKTLIAVKGMIYLYSDFKKVTGENGKEYYIAGVKVGDGSSYLIDMPFLNSDSVARDHIANRLNPHNVTKAQVGLGNVDNTRDADKPISTAMQTALDKKADKTLATASANGLMSATDKARLDKLWAAMNGGLDEEILVSPYVITMPIELSDGTLLATTDNEVLLFEESHVIAPCNCNHS